MMQAHGPCGKDPLADVLTRQQNDVAIPRVPRNPVVQRRYFDTLALKHLQEMVPVIVQQTRHIQPPVVALARLDQRAYFKALRGVTLAVIDETCEIHQSHLYYNAI